ncbi:copper-binding protein [Stappia sp. GBMRC 2046]|uniref:Copper-binding protein n=1 Tax=Stappia sediminis TaxID=2692190 RepID=A0A7X3S9B0_9HYPH|nr:cupredoxin family copper-binding protein [Stappia sediminis]MXN66570.1 copper-binding protein [Stappia sediminis]
MHRFGQICGALSGAAFSLMLACCAAYAGQTHQVIIQKFEFVPANLTIKRGDTVEFVNKDIAPHTASEESDFLWDTGELVRNQSARIEFTKAGTSKYFCVFHPHMKAEIIVTAN